jgi:hypothetical protein
MSAEGASGTSLYRVYRIGATALSLIILIGLTIYIFYDSFEVETLYSWHPSFFTLGVSKYVRKYFKFMKLVFDVIYWVIYIYKHTHE